VIARVGEPAVELGEHEPPDVVQQRGDRELVAVVQSCEVGDPVGGVPGRHRVAAKALVAGRERVGRLEGVVGLDGLGDLSNPGRGQDLHRLADPARPSMRPATVVSGPHHLDRERGVRLDRGGHLVGRHRGGVAGADQAATGLGESGQGGNGVERRREALASMADAAARRLRRRCLRLAPLGLSGLRLGDLGLAVAR